MHGIFAIVGVLGLVMPVSVTGQETRSPQKPSASTSMALRLIRKDSGQKNQTAAVKQRRHEAAPAPRAEAEPSPAIAKAEPKTVPRAEPAPVVAKAEPKAAPKSEAKAPAVAKAEPKPTARSDSKPSPAVAKAEAKPAPKPESKPAPAVAKVDSRPNPVKPAPATVAKVPPKPTVKPAAVAESSARVSGRPPTVVWRRGMSIPGSAADLVALDAESNSAPATVQVSIETPGATKRSLTPLAANSRPPAPRLPSREELVTALTAIGPGTPRAQVIDRLGKPAYAIAMSEGATYVERCRFRAGGENVASIEFRDGVVATIHRLAP